MSVANASTSSASASMRSIKRRDRQSLSREFNSILAIQTPISNSISSASISSPPLSPSPSFSSLSSSSYEPNALSSLTSPSNSSSSSTADAYKEWQELPADPRPFQALPNRLSPLSPPSVHLPSSPHSDSSSSSPSLNPSTSSLSSAFSRDGVYSLLHLLYTSILSGASLTPTLFIPRSVWLQRDHKISAYALQLEYFNIILESLSRLNLPDLSRLPSSAPTPAAEEVSSPTLSSASSSSLSPLMPDPFSPIMSAALPPPSIIFEQMMIELDEPLCALRNSLASVQSRACSSLSFIPRVPDYYRATPALFSTNDGLHSSNTSSSPSSTLSNKISSFWKSAASTLNDVMQDATSFTKRPDEAELTAFVTLIQSVLEASLACRTLHDLRIRAEKALGSNDRLAFVCAPSNSSIDSSPLSSAASALAPPASSGSWSPSSTPLQSPLHAPATGAAAPATPLAVYTNHLRVLDEQLYTIVCSLILHELQILVERYLKHQWRSMTFTSSQAIHKKVQELVRDTSANTSSTIAKSLQSTKFKQRGFENH